MTAMAALSDSLFDPNWYPNSGATNHCTFDQRFFKQVRFTRSEKIYMSNGDGFDITHTGNFFLFF